MASKPKIERSTNGDKAPRWSPPPERWPSDAGARAAADAWLAGAAKLIAKGKPAAHWTEAERLGMRIATDLHLCFAGGAPEDWLEHLQRAADALRGNDGLKRRRYYAARTIADWAQKWRDPSWQASDETRRRCLEQCARELALHDDAFSTFEDFEVLAVRLDACDVEPKGKRGAKGPERTLAEILVLDLDGSALGLAATHEEDDESAIDRIRKVISRDCDEIFSSIKTAGK